MYAIKGQNISFQYQEKFLEVLTKISFHVHKEAKIGIIGKNGSGKSTLIKIILGHLKPTAGFLQTQRDLKIGYLPQDYYMHDGMQVIEVLRHAATGYRVKDSQFNFIKPTHEMPQLIFEDDSIDNSGKIMSGIYKALHEFELDQQICRRTVASLSGGEKTKIGLVALHLQNPQLYILDEPTNHLDILGVNCLKKCLLQRDLPYIIVSHDRSLLESSVSEIWSIEDGKLEIYSGNYTFYKNRRDLEVRRKNQEYFVMQKKVKQLKAAAQERRKLAEKNENFKFSRSKKKNGGLCKRDEGSGSSRANLGKNIRTAKAMEKRADMIIDNHAQSAPISMRKRKIVFPVISPSPSLVTLSCQSLGLSFGQKSLFSQISLVLVTGERLAIVGVNGAGKTSFLNLLAGIIYPTFGSLSWAASVTLSVFCQDQGNLHFDQTVLAEVWDPDICKQAEARTVLACLGINARQMDQKIGDLSSGERVKVSLAKAVLSGANTFLLDEPTNHLEIEAREMLELALLSYQGTLIFTSHDHCFVKNVATKIWDISENRFFDNDLKDRNIS